MAAYRQKGYTLIEVLLSVVILSVGLIAVFRPLITSAGVLNYLEQRMEVSRLISEKIWEIQTNADLMGRMTERMGRGSLLGRRTVYAYRLEARSLSPDEKLSELTYDISWQQSNFRKRLTQVSYVLTGDNDSE